MNSPGLVKCRCSAEAFSNTASGKDDRRPGFQAALARCRQLGAMLVIYAAMAQKERELINERTRAALAAAKARGASLGGDRGYRPPAPPCAANAAVARADEADRMAHRVRIEIERLRQDGTTTLAGLARGLTSLGVPTPRRGGAWTHTTVSRAIERVQAIPQIA